MPVAVETVPAAAAATPARRKLDNTPFTPNTPQDSPRKRNAKKNKKQDVEGLEQPVAGSSTSTEEWAWRPLTESTASAVPPVFTKDGR